MTDYIMNTYNRFPIVFTKGDGMYVYDNTGKKYLDFVAGIAVNSLGHNDKDLVKAISHQAETLIHISNLYWSEPQLALAEKLVKKGDLDKCFFCNSGAEAIEGALKLSRKYGADKGKTEIITMYHSFHGRTYGAITATGQEHYQEGLGKLLPDIKYATFNDLDSVKALVNDKTCAILVEPIQGEGGILPATKEFLQGLRTICDEQDIMLIFDEIQCGVGRLGTFFAYQSFGICPDALTMAKGIAGGVPMGVLMAKEKFAGAFKPGDHASTFGGNPLATAAANVVVDKLDDSFLNNVKTTGQYLTEKLLELKEKYPVIAQVRGIALMQGIELTVPVAPIIKTSIESGVLLVNAGKNVIRFVPSLIATKKNVDDMITTLDKSIQSNL